MDEYIERESLIKRLCERCNEEMSESPCEPSDCFAREVIKTIPAADVAQVVHGRWIEYTKVIIPEPYNKWEQAWKCSECGFDDGFVGYNYCPNCGAKMDGGND